MIVTRWFGYLENWWMISGGCNWGNFTCQHPVYRHDGPHRYRWSLRAWCRQARVFLRDLPTYVRQKRA